MNKINIITLDFSNVKILGGGVHWNPHHKIKQCVILTLIFFVLKNIQFKKVQLICVNRKSQLTTIYTQLFRSILGRKPIESK